MNNQQTLPLLIEEFRHRRLTLVQFVNDAGNECFASTEILHEMQKARKSKDWFTLQALVIVTGNRLSFIFVPELCAILDDHASEMTNEDVAEILGEIRDPRAINSLEQATILDLPGDHSHQLNMKCVRALSSIKTDESRRAIERVAKENIFPEVREAAEFELRT